MEIVFDACKNDYFIDGEIKKIIDSSSLLNPPPPPTPPDELWLNQVHSVFGFKVWYG